MDVKISSPLLPLRDIVVFPSMVIPLFVGREKSINALNIAMDLSKEIILIAQKKADQDDPTADDLHSVGTIAKILQLLKLPDGTVKVLVEGQKRVKITNIKNDSNFLKCDYEIAEDINRELKDLSAVEMEGAAVAQVAIQEKVPFLIIRVISDSADDSASQNFNDFLKVYEKESCHLIEILVNNFHKSPLKIY